MVNRRRPSGTGKGIKAGEGDGMVSDVLKDAGGKVAGKCSDGGGMCSGESGSRKRQHSESSRDEQGGTSTGHPVLRSSKRLKKDESPPPEHKKEQEEPEKGPNGGTAETPVRGKKKCQKRTWESWNQEDKDAFFEALYEYGKDFESIQAHIANKHKKRGDPPSLTKNKDQVRHLYYRTWNKISKFLDINEDVKKAVQELYGLINYGELRKKIGRMDEKNGHKLNELIKYGVTTVRVKGKNVRIKTPVCRALKKLNNIDDDEDKRPEKLPPRVQLELLPHSNQTWAVIQGLAQNPRVRLNIPLHRRVSSLLEFLQVKWTPHRVKILQQLSVSEETKLHLSILPPPGASINPIPVTGKVVHSKNFCYIAEPTKNTKPLVITNAILSAKGKSGNSRPSQADNTTNKSCSSDAVTVKQDGSNSRCSNDEDSQISKSSKVDSQQSEQDSKQQVRDSAADSCVSQCQCNTEEEECRCKRTAVHDNCPGHEGVSESDRTDVGSAETGQTSCTDGSSVNSTDAHKQSTTAQERDMPGKGDGSEESPVNESPANNSNSTSDPAVGTHVVQQSDAIQHGDGVITDNVQQDVTPDSNAKKSDCVQEQTVREGWTLQTVGMLTFAELFVMLGKPSKLQLEYDWVQEKIVDVDHVSAVWKIIRLAAIELDLLNNKQKNVSVGTSPMKMPPASPPGVPGGSPPAAVSPSASRIGVRKPQSPPNNKALQPTATSTPIRRDSAGFIMPTTVAPARARPAAQLTQADREFRAQLDSLNKRPDIFLPRKTRGRGGRKPIVVQRTLLPRPSQPSRHMMSLSFIHNSHAAIQGSFTPILPRKTPSPAATTSRLIAPKTAAHTVTAGQSLAASTGGAISLAAQAAGVPGAQLRPAATPKPLSAVDSPVSVQTHSPVPTYPVGSPGQLVPSQTPTPQHTLPAHPQPVPEPTTISTKSAQDMGLTLAAVPGTSAGGSLGIMPDQEGALSVMPTAGAGMADPILDINMTDGMTGTLSSHSREGLEIPAVSPNTSPSKLCLESVLLNGEAGDITLSSLLATLQSPEKAKNMSLGGGSVLFSEESRDSLASKHALDVDTALHAMMNENSVDYIAKFSELAAQVAGCATPSTTRTTDNDTEALGFSCLASADVDMTEKR
ncbi:protein cramped-like isoform X1 [Branchiostoma floridae]|uniref:Protein cramped-like isoform X1 n=2 Tax=Branchiostoma floridae TaxID=7739 RepID=A0A9J7LEU6_BRAFL|nr:protein cramped-like isoform X1 [Branchiostoma floridae]